MVDAPIFYDYDPETGIGNPATPLSAAGLNSVLGAFADDINDALGEKVDTDTLDPVYAATGDASYIGYYGTLGLTSADAAANSALIASALTQTNVLRLPAAKFWVSSTITLTANKKLIGAGRGATVITSDDATLTTISVAGDSPAVIGVTVTKEVNPTGAVCYGIDAGLTTDGAVLRDVRVQKHHIGVRLGGAGLSQMQDAVVQWNSSHGVYITNAVSTINSLQWYLRDVLSQGNTGDGFRVQSTAAKGSCSFGKLVSCYTFANSGRGLIATAPALADRIAAIRVSSCFFGQDGNDEIYLDTYSGTHQISDTYCELTGSMVTGPGIFAGSGSAVTAAQSNTGVGMVFTANNDTIIVNGCQVVQNSRSGLVSSATDLILTSTTFLSNGRALVATARYGAQIAAGSAQITGCRARNTGGVTYQEYGFAFGVTDVLFLGNDLRGNVTAGFAGSTPTVNANNRT